MTEESGHRKARPGRGSYAFKPRYSLVSDWMILDAMGRKRIRTVRELTERLAEAGVKKSEPQVSRIVRKMPEYLSIELLKALLCVLDCDLSDLIRFQRVPIEGEKPSTVEPIPSPIGQGKKSDTSEKAMPEKRGRKKSPFDLPVGLLSGMPDDDEDLNDRERK